MDRMLCTTKQYFELRQASEEMIHAMRDLETEKFPIEFDLQQKCKSRPCSQKESGEKVATM